MLRFALPRFAIRRFAVRRFALPWFAICTFAIRRFAIRRCLLPGLAAMVICCGGLFAQKTEPGAAEKNVSLSSVDAIMNAAIARGTIPGGVVLVGHDGEVVYRKAFGMRSLEPAREAMTADTIFDIASLTKCVVTSTAVMQLAEQGKLRLNDPVSAYLPEFARNGKENITLRALLTHFSGLPEDLDLKTRWRGRETRYLPPAQWRPRIAPTEYGEGRRMMRGTVHDPTAERMGGVAGHAGVFSTADELAKWAQEILHPSKPNSDFHPNKPNPGLLGTPGFHPNKSNTGLLGTPGVPGTPLGGLHVL